MDKGYRKDGDWALNIKSVIVFGRMRIVEDEDKKRKICTENCTMTVVVRDDEEKRPSEVGFAGTDVTVDQIIDQVAS